MAKLSAMAVSLSSFPSTRCFRHDGENSDRSHFKPFAVHRQTVHALPTVSESNGLGLVRHRTKQRRSAVTAATKGSGKSKESVPEWAKPESDEPPPWAREQGRGSTPQDSFEIPFFVYLLASAITAIAAIGSIFEYVNKKPVFGVLSSDSVFYTPLLGFFAITGVPTSAFLWYKSVQTANKEAEEQDKKDGFL